MFDASVRVKTKNGMEEKGGECVKAKWGGFGERRNEKGETSGKDRGEEKAKIKRKSEKEDTEGGESASAR